MSESDIGGDLPPLDPELAAWLAADTPGPMPDEVWTRLEARIAAEPPLVPAGVVDLDSERTRRRRVLPWLVGAAGVMVVGAVVLPSMQTSSPAPVADGGTAQPAVVAAASPDAGALTTTPPPPQQQPAAPAQSLPRAIISTGTDYTADTLPEQVTTLLATAGMGDAAAVANMITDSPPVTAMPGEGLTATPEALADCLGRLGLPPESLPLVLDRASIDGRDASVIVTVGSWGADGRPDSLHAVAVGQDCTDADVAAAQHWDMPLR